jgi:hypothetical protein
LTSTKKRSKDVTADEIATVRMNGKEARLIIENFEELLKIADLTKDEHSENLIVVQSFITYWNFLRIPCQTAGDRENKAVEAKKLAVKFVNLYSATTGNSEVVWYMHAAVHHIPDFIRRLPSDIFHCSGQGIEQFNQLVKNSLRRTNHHVTASRGNRVRNGKFTQVGKLVKCREYLLRIIEGRKSRHMKRLVKEEGRKGSPLKPKFQFITEIATQLQPVTATKETAVPMSIDDAETSTNGVGKSCSKESKTKSLRHAEDLSLYDLKARGKRAKVTPKSSVDHPKTYTAKGENICGRENGS